MVNGVRLIVLNNKCKKKVKYEKNTFIYAVSLQLTIVYQNRKLILTWNIYALLLKNIVYRYQRDKDIFIKSLEGCGLLILVFYS